MNQKIGMFFDRFLWRRSLDRWRVHASGAIGMDPATLRPLRRTARQIRREIDRFLHVADGRLARPDNGAAPIRRPHLCDWAWRPDIWRGPISHAGIAAAGNRTTLGEQATIFHDCSRSEIILRQTRNLRPDDLAAYGLRMEVFRFDGSYLSLVLDLPEGAIHGLDRSHVIRMDLTVEAERHPVVTARLNVRHGPNSERIVREIAFDSADAMVEFDLAYSNMNEKRVDKLWVDLIFKDVDMNGILLRDVTFSRRPRAEL